MDKTAVQKNKPRFFSVLLTLIFIAAGILGIYKVRSLHSGGSFSAFLPEDKSVSAEVTADTSETEPTTEAVDEEAVAAAQAIGKADASLSPAFLSYISENCEAKALQTVLSAMSKKEYDKEVWFTATGSSFYALNALADGAVDKGEAVEIADAADEIEIAFAGKVNAAHSGAGASAVSAELQKVMKEADVQVLANDCVFSADGKTGTYLADAKSAAMYKELGVDLVTLASTHMSANGSDGIKQTVKTLDDNKIAHVGAGSDVNEAAKPAVFLAGGRKISFLGVSDTLAGRTANAATASAAGVFSMRNSADAVRNAVKTAKADSDYVFVYLNAGIDENANWFDSDQSGWSKALIDAGADGVIGAHSTRLQGMEFYKGKLIVYGLGNFLYDGKTRETGIYKIAIAKDGTFSHSFVAGTQSGGKVSAAADKNAVFSRISKFCGNVVKLDQNGRITSNRR